MIQYVCANSYAKQYTIANKIIKNWLEIMLIKPYIYGKETIIYLTSYKFKERFSDFIFSLSIENFKVRYFKIRELLNKFN